MPYLLLVTLAAIAAGGHAMPLHLIRSITEPVSEYSYDFKTDVWVYGDREGYADLISDLQRARSGSEPIHVAAIPPDSEGMRCVILPASKYPTGKAAVRAVERFVFCRAAATMQVVLCANQRGFAKLLAVARNAMSTTGGPLDHWHCDDDVDPWLLKRSVSLNLRGAVRGWSPEELDVYFEEIRSGGDYRLPPSNMEYLKSDPYYSYDYLPTDMSEFMFTRSGPHIIKCD